MKTSVCPMSWWSQGLWSNYLGMNADSDISMGSLSVECGAQNNSCEGIHSQIMNKVL